MEAQLNDGGGGAYSYAPFCRKYNGILLLELELGNQPAPLLFLRISATKRSLRQPAIGCCSNYLRR